MQDVGIKLKARIDTGAGVSSIDAKVLQIKPVAGGSGERVVFEIVLNCSRPLGDGSTTPDDDQRSDRGGRIPLSASPRRCLERVRVASDAPDRPATADARAVKR